jgi:hypothetical protein
MFEMVMARSSAIACGYKDANDLSRLRHDPLMKITVSRCPQSGAALASQLTISRLENAPSKTEAARLCAALVDQFGTTVKQSLVGSRSSTSTTRSVRRMADSSYSSVLECASRRAWLCVDAHLSRGERQAGSRHPPAGAHAEGDRGEDRHQARNEAS